MKKMLVHLTRMETITVEVDVDDARAAVEKAVGHANGGMCGDGCHEPTSEADGDWEAFQVDQMVIDPDTGLATGFQTIAGMDGDPDHGWVLKFAEGH